MILQLTRALLAAPFSEIISVSTRATSKGAESLHFALDAGSVITWKCAMNNGFNNGSFDVGAGDIITKNGVVTGGNIVIPIASLKNFNIPDSSLKQLLLQNLKGLNFFHLAVFPEASFRIRKIRPYNGGGTTALPGANYHVEGSFTMLGKSRTIAFPAYIRISGDRMEIAATFSIDRTLWGMTYASDPSAPLYIHKEVALQLHISARRM